jgi:U3 small nucleolar RNA-associated protein 21
MSGKLQRTIPVASPIAKLLLHPTVPLLALACDDHTLRILDADTLTLIRVFPGHRGRITDLAFSPDARWLVSAALDATVRTWDIPSGFMVDGFRCDEIVTSLAFSPTGDFLATAHAQQIGVYLWANRNQFAVVPLMQMRDKDMPRITVAGHFEQRAAEVMLGGEEDEGDQDAEDAMVEAEGEGMASNEPWVRMEEMITLSSLPTSSWQNLLHLGEIKVGSPLLVPPPPPPARNVAHPPPPHTHHAHYPITPEQKRNKPTSPPKAPEKAPFFLPTTSGVTPTFVAEAAAEQGSSLAGGRHASAVLKKGDAELQSPFQRHLLAGERRCGVCPCSWLLPLLMLVALEGGQC